MDLLAPGHCPVCSTPLQVCGHAPALVTPSFTFEKGTTMSGPATNEYDVDVNGTKTTLRLSDADARARGLLGDGPATTDLAAAGSAPIGARAAATDPYASAGDLTPEAVDAAVAQRAADRAAETAEAAKVAADDAKKSATAANKARTAANKGAGSGSPTADK